MPQIALVNKHGHFEGFVNTCTFSHPHTWNVPDYPPLVNCLSKEINIEEMTIKTRQYVMSADKLHGYRMYYEKDDGSK